MRQLDKIDEMANVIDRTIHEFDNCLSSQDLAIVLYGAGYRKQVEGEWVQTKEKVSWWDVEGKKCSVCGNFFAQVYAYDFKFCPNCGAKMKGEDNGKDD